MSETSSIVGKFDFPEMFSGDSLIGFEITISEDDAQADLDTAEIKFYPAGSTTVALTLSVGSGLTVVSDESPWIVAVDDILNVTLAAGLYTHKCRFVDVDGIRETHLTGSWKIR